MKTLNIISGNKIGNVVNAFINGKFYKKAYDNADDAFNCYKQLLNANQNPTDENIDSLIFEFTGINLNLIKQYGLEYDTKNNKVYLEGFQTEIPELLVETFKDYSLNNFPIDAIKAFWNLLMVNPDQYIRENLFNYINNYNLVITNNGYFVAYKAVAIVTEKQPDNVLIDFVTHTHNKVKQAWKKNSAKYTVYLNHTDDQYYITNESTFKTWDLQEKNVSLIGNLLDLYNYRDQLETENGVKSYTDKYSRTMDIKIGEPCSLERNKCDNDSNKSCSHGLHVGAVKYVNRYADKEDEILICLINPANVVAIPKNETSKIRVSEYYPISIANRNDDGTIDAINVSYFESDYINYEKKELDKMINLAKNNQKHIDARNVNDIRTNSEIIKILSERIKTIS